MIEVLLVDDEAMIRALLRNVITVALPGAAIVEAESGDRALLLARSHPPFQLVVTDIMMPGIDGLDMARKLVAGGQASRFVFVSGYADPEKLQTRLRAFPKSVFLTKPFDLPRLIKTIRSMADTAGRAPEPARKAAVRRHHQRAEFRLPVRPNLSLEGGVRRVARLAAKNAKAFSALKSAVFFRQSWLNRISDNLAIIRAIERGFPQRPAA